MSKPKFLLNDHYAVVFKADRWAGTNPSHHREILNQSQWDELQKLAKEGIFIILESWLITEGRCVSN